MGMTIEGVWGEETDKEDGAKIAAADPGRIDRYNTSNVYPWKQRGEVQILNRTFPTDVARTRAHERNTIQKLKVDWIAPLHGVGNGYMPIVSVNLNPGHTMGSMKRIIIVQFLSPLFRLLHLCLLRRSLLPFLRSRKGPTPVPSCTSRFRCLYIHTYVYVHVWSSKTYERDSSFDSWAALSR